ncbi:MAG: hypothetical protein KIS85_06740 [Anaerolineales bacterium]|nr:hypothetical protein [Anaerolineales bacterium]
MDIESLYTPTEVDPPASAAVSHSLEIEVFPEGAEDGAPFQDAARDEVEEQNASGNPGVQSLDGGASYAPLQVSSDKRLGIHYFADTKHYSQAHLEKWLPAIQSLGVNWITLPAPLDRAIPSELIGSLIANDIQPVLQFDIPLTEEYQVEDFAALFGAYANWGVRYVVLFDRPNLRSQWPGVAWTQRGLVDNFLDKFVPLARAAREAGLTPVFPALEPGGDYWDTAFLRSALEALQARGESELLAGLVLGAYAWTYDKSLIWGAGGPESWPATMPYHTPPGSEDQLGFRIFDWYNAISRAVTGQVLPIILVAAGVQRETMHLRDAQIGRRALNITETLQRAPSDTHNNRVPANVLACNFWLLSAPLSSPSAEYAWFKYETAKPSKHGEEWLASRAPQAKAMPDALQSDAAPTSTAPKSAPAGMSHYLLLPNSSDWPMELVRSFLQSHQATVGTSLQQAAASTRVTLAGGLEGYPDEILRTLIQAGCTVDNLQTA